MLLSIVIPVYNIDSYLNKCLDSIVYQVKCNTEIILIDDGSCDKSSFICDYYSNKYDFIKVIHQLNSGLSFARNKGIELANGKYIWFIDGDDFIEPNSLEIIYKYLNYNYDILVFNYNIISNNISSVNSFYNYNNINTKYLLSHCMVWNKVFKKELFNNNLFPNNLVYEDLYLIPTLILKTNNIVFLNDYLYNYVKRSNSIKNSYNRINDRVLGVNNIYNKLNNKYYLETEYLYIYNLLITSLIEEINNKYKYDIKYLNKLVKDKYKYYYRNSYFNLHTKVYLFLLYYGFYKTIRFITKIKFGGIYESNK